MSKDTQKGSKGSLRRRVQVKSYGSAVSGAKTVQFEKICLGEIRLRWVDDAAGKCEQRSLLNQEISIFT